MRVKHMRIDDRLIHGQIVTAWIRETKAEAILVADDLAARDATQKMLLQLATPRNVKLYIESLEKSASLLKEGGISEDLLLIVRNPRSANVLFELGFSIDSVNVGNISNSKSATGRKMLLSYIYLEEQDVENLKSISEKGIALDVRSVPGDKRIDGMELIKNKY